MAKAEYLWDYAYIWDMKRFGWILLATIVALMGCVFVSCNDEVFVKAPDIVDPNPEPEPEPDPDPEPDINDFLMLQSITYDESSIKLVEDVINSSTRVTYKFNGTGGNATILYDNYNSSLVRISSNTQFLLPWAEVQPSIFIPTLDAQLTPGFWGLEIPFEMGLTEVPCQYMAGERESLYVPDKSEVTATVYIQQRIVKAQATITYQLVENPAETPAEARVNVEVWQPVGIRVEWSDIKAIE